MNQCTCRLNNCIGKRNYRYFLWFVFALPVAMVYILAFSIVHIVIVWVRRSAFWGFISVLLNCPAAYPLQPLGALDVLRLTVCLLKL